MSYSKIFFEHPYLKGQTQLVEEKRELLLGELEAMWVGSEGSIKINLIRYDLEEVKHDRSFEIQL